MSVFIGRRKELTVLENAYKGPQSAFIPVYGRRRVGKSELILRFLKGKPGIYYLGKKAPPGMQIREFLEEASFILDEPLLARYPADQWGPALGAVVDRWKSRRKLIIAIDEFQWVAGSSPELPSVLQEKWDRQWKQAGNILIILCGSYVGFMEREVLGRKSPLFGRRTAQILLRPFGYREAAEFHPSYSLVDRARTYFICGGIPYYLKFFSDNVSVEKNIEVQLLEEHGALHREPDFLMREELRELENYYAILLSIASGDTTIRSIARHTGIGERSLHYYVKQLGELGYIRRRFPLTKLRRIPRHVRYDLSDPLLRFWFRFLFPQTSYIIQMGARRALRERIRPDLQAYFGNCFDRLCREALPFLYQQEEISASFDVGEFWDKSTQIDVVCVRDDGWIDLGECKWGSARSSRKVLQELEAKAAKYPNPENASIGLRVFTRQKIHPGKTESGKNKKITWHCLDDLYS